MMRLLLIVALLGSTFGCRGEDPPPSTPAEFGTGTGVRLVQGDDGVWSIDEVASGSPAAAAGVQVGDRVIAVNGVHPPKIETQDCALAGVAVGDWKRSVLSAGLDDAERFSFERDGKSFDAVIAVTALAPFIRGSGDPSAIGSGLMAGCKMCWSGCPTTCGGVVVCKWPNQCSTPCTCG